MFNTLMVKTMIVTNSHNLLSSVSCLCNDARSHGILVVNFHSCNFSVVHTIWRNYGFYIELREIVLGKFSTLWHSSMKILLRNYLRCAQWKRRAFVSTYFINVILRSLNTIKIPKDNHLFIITFDFERTLNICVMNYLWTLILSYII